MTASTSPMHTPPYARVLASLTRLPNVSGAIVVDLEQGLVVDSNVQFGVDADAVAALSATLYRKARSSSRTAGLGEVSLLRLEAELGQLYMVGAGELLLVAIADARASIGQLRAEVQRAARSLA